MDLTLYDIIRAPHISSKVYRLNQTHKQLVLNIHPEANKPLVAQALKKLFNVEVEKVRIIVTKGKQRRSGRFTCQDALRKKAVVTLKEGYSIDAMNIASMNANAPVAEGENS